MEELKDIDIRNPECIPNDFKFNAELDFVNQLADISYIEFLEEENYLNNEQFQRYLNYLEYWQQPEYRMLLKDERSLYFLKELESDAFVQGLKSNVSLGEGEKTLEETYLEYLEYVNKFAQEEQNLEDAMEKASEEE